MGLFFANVGWFDFPIRIHVNAGYWWSRDDGAVYMRQLPGALPLSGADIVHNDLLFGGLAIEAGLPASFCSQSCRPSSWSARAPRCAAGRISGGSRLECVPTSGRASA